MCGCMRSNPNQPAGRAAAPSVRKPPAPLQAPGPRPPVRRFVAALGKLTYKAPQAPDGEKYEK